MATFENYEIESNGYLLIVPNSATDLSIKINENSLAIKADTFVALPVKKADILSVITGVEKIYFLPAQEVYIDEN